MAPDSKPAYIDMELVQSHLAVATEYVADMVSASYRDGVTGVLRYMPSVQFDSPLEAIFWLWWEACAQVARVGEMLSLSPQHEVVLVTGEHYRLDFLIEPYDQQVSSHKKWVPLAVELDGHGFHERTREQVAHRDQRDRALQKAGWKVFHFSFAEFTAHPETCVSEVILFARNQANRVSMAIYMEGRSDAR